MMHPRLLITALLLILTATLSGQKLDFIGLKGISFGMKAEEMKDKTIILDSTSAYKDTITYLKNTRCQNYFRKTQDLQLSNFKASSIQYEFCDGELTYVFITVDGEKEINSALTELKKTFHRLGCKGKDLTQCTNLDASANGIRVIVNVDRKKQTMSFALISKKPR